MGSCLISANHVCFPYRLDRRRARIKSGFGVKCTWHISGAARLQKQGKMTGGSCEYKVDQPELLYLAGPCRTPQTRVDKYHLLMDARESQSCKEGENSPGMGLGGKTKRRKCHACGRHALCITNAFRLPRTHGLPSAQSESPWSAQRKRQS